MVAKLVIKHAQILLGNLIYFQHVDDNKNEEAVEDLYATQKWNVRPLMKPPLVFVTMIAEQKQSNH